MDQIKIGKFIQNMRKKKDLTQKELGDKLGVTFQAVSKWESGDTLPDCSILLDLCSILEVNVETLLRGGIYLKNDRKILRVSDVVNGFKAIEDVKKYFGKDSLFYQGMIEGINNKMNMDLEKHLTNSFEKEVLIAEVLIQGIISGKYYVDIEEVDNFFTNKKMVSILKMETEKIK